MLREDLILIAHRGNTEGRKPESENRPSYILEALKQGFDVEIDVWYHEGKWFLGHDKPTCQISFQFLLTSKLWCHAKTIRALLRLSRIKQINCFWHENDRCSLTSKGYIWSLPNCEMTSKSICVLGKELFVPKICAGICCDDVGVLIC